MFGSGVMKKNENDFQIGGMFMTKGRYQTKQREELLAFLQSVSGEHITVNDIHNHFAEHGSKVGVTTIYRHLENMVNEGIVKKYVLDSNSAACFEYVDTHKECKENGCTHLKCTNCGKLIHLHCEDLQATEKHIFEAHNFKVDTYRTVLYGLCEKCQ